MDTCTGQNACNTAKYLKDRQPQTYTLKWPSSFQFELKDNTLMAGWYRGMDGSELVNKPVPYNSCGTMFPIWADGEFPPKGQDMNVSACVVSDTCDCKKSYPIKIKNCGKYNVYFLVPTELSTEAYCFQSMTKDVLRTPNTELQSPTKMARGRLQYLSQFLVCLIIGVSTTAIIIAMYKICEFHRVGREAKTGDTETEPSDVVTV